MRQGAAEKAFWRYDVVERGRPESNSLDYPGLPTVIQSYLKS